MNRPYAVRTLMPNTRDEATAAMAYVMRQDAHAELAEALGLVSYDGFDRDRHATTPIPVRRTGLLKETA